MPYDWTWLNYNRTNQSETYVDESNFEYDLLDNAERDVVYYEKDTDLVDIFRI